MANFIFPAFFPDGRANRLEKYQVEKRADGLTPDAWMYLCGPHEVARQIALVNEGKCGQIVVPRESQRLGPRIPLSPWTSGRQLDTR